MSREQNVHYVLPTTIKTNHCFLSRMSFKWSDFRCIMHKCWHF